MTNKGLLADEGVDAWTYTTLDLKAVAASGTPTDPTLSTLGDPQYNWCRYTIDPSTGTCVAQYQFQTIDAAASQFDPGTGDAWVFRLPVPARRLGVGVPIGTAMAYRSFNPPLTNIKCVPQLADESWPQLRSDPDSWFQVAVPYGTYIPPTATITGTSGSGESVTLAHEMPFTPKAYDFEVVSVTPGPTAGGAPFSIEGINSTQYTVIAFNITAGVDWDFNVRIVAEPPTGGGWVGPRLPFKWQSYFASGGEMGNLFIRLRYEIAR